MIRFGCAAAVLGVLTSGCSDEDEPSKPAAGAFAQLQEALGGQADLAALQTLKIAGRGDIVFPRKLRLARGGHTLLDENVTSVEVNGSFDADTFVFPNGAMPVFDQERFDRGELTHQWYYLLDSIGLPFNGIDTAITPRVLAEGVLQLNGGSHHSFLVEQAAGVVLVDAPFYEDRGRALSQYIASNFPGKPITHVVASHFHEDHTAGIREVLGSNPTAQLVVHESVRDTWRTILAAPSTLRPDAQVQAQLPQAQQP
jgi:hypothetical protein